jgi:hypothetical protein
MFSNSSMNYFQIMLGNSINCFSPLRKEIIVKLCMVFASCDVCMQLAGSAWNGFILDTSFNKFLF